MKRESQITTRETSPAEDIVLLPPDEATAVAEFDARHRRAQMVAKLRLLWQNRLFLSKAFVAGLIVFLLIAFLIPARFQSTTRLMPPDQQSGQGITMLAALAGKAGMGADALTGIAGDILGLKTSADLFIGILSSRTVQDHLIDKFNLKKVYGERRWEDARKKLVERTDLSSDRKSGIISISVVDHSPQRAAAMASEYVQQLNWMVTQLNTSTAHRERVFLEERLNQVQEDLERSEKDFSQFASKNIALDIPTQGKAMVEATAALEGQLIAAQTELQGLKQIYADSNVRVRSTQARIDELLRQLQNLRGKVSTGANGQEQDGESLYPSMRRLPILGVEYADLLRRNKIQEAVYESLTQQYELAKVQEVKETPSVKVLDAPDIPEKKSFPPRLLITLVGGIGVLLFGVWWILGWSQWRLADPQDPARILVQDVENELRGRLPAFFPSGNGSGAEYVRGQRPFDGASEQHESSERGKREDS
jgi:capsule polysaccharide export protein KpsE/RkpR